MIQVIQPFGLDMSCEAVTEKSVSEHMSFYELKYSNRMVYGKIKKVLQIAGQPWSY